MEFEFDTAKSAANRDKHGIDFVEAQALWTSRAIERPLPYEAEARWVRFGQMSGRLWAAIFTLRDGKVRIISVRRARREEEKDYGHITD